MSQLATITAIPREDLNDWNRESDEAQAQVLRWLNRYELIEKAPHGTKCEAIKALSVRTGIAASTISNKFKRYREQGWRAFINRAKHPDPREANLPAAFTEWVASLYERFQRKNAGKQVHKYICDRNRKWRATLEAKHALPGFSTPLQDGPEGYPENISYRTVLRLKPKKINLIIRRQGRKAASMLTPSNYTTRVGLKFGQRIFFDDQEYDIKVNLLGYNDKGMRPKGFNALDHLSGCFLDYTAKMTIWCAEEEKKRDLKLKDFTWFSVKNLLEVGYRDDEVGTTHIYEHGTTTGFNNQQLSTPDGFHSYDEALHYITGGNVTVERSGRFNDPMFSGMLFRPSSTGNFKFKSPLESIFNLVRNYMAALPGPTGQHFGLAPEELHGMDNYNTQLLKVVKELPAERRELLLYPYLDYPEFIGVLVEVYQSINDRIDHQLEGWDLLNFSQKCFRLEKSQPWQPRESLLKVDPDRREAIGQLAEWRSFPLSPRQVKEAHMHELTKLDRSLVPLLLPREWAVPVKVNKHHEIHIKDSEVAKEPFIYLPRFRTRYGNETLDAGKECLAYWHPICGDHMWLCNLDGSYIGTVPRFIKPVAGDTPAILRNQGKINAVTADLVRDSGRRASGVVDERKHMKRNNDRVTDIEQPVTAEEVSTHREGKKRVRRIEKHSKKESRTGLTRDDLI